MGFCTHSISNRMQEAQTKIEPSTPPNISPFQGSSASMKMFYRDCPYGLDPTNNGCDHLFLNNSAIKGLSLFLSTVGGLDRLQIENGGKICTCEGNLCNRVPPTSPTETSGGSSLKIQLIVFLLMLLY
ncbi:uncharacterized protein LOC106171705 [Lingula anatina]|uniref:Uncharacterized protein LOC106171705 n=1 Tax=Lingula anatina TaxID=7574 RepID=A0A1S3JB24_LINAN|nr:uncharacterized protein LOC106171705 [Lingula anatina]|eukprot:XP_013407605.1 uncharacterized protein LOC106171705 [Lingula anatina]